MTAALAALLLLAVAGLVLLLAKAFAQNDGLLRKVRASGRPVRTVLGNALSMWAPLGVVIVLLSFASNRLGAGAVQAGYRWTTLDAYCVVSGLPSQFLVPCTGLGRRIPRADVHPAGKVADLDALVSARYAQVRRDLLDVPVEVLQARAANRDALYASLSPSAILGLERAPEDDPELVRIKRALRAELATPPAPTPGLLDMLGFGTEREDHVRRLRTLTAQLLARRERVSAQVYASLPAAEQGRLFLRHRLSHQLTTTAPVMDPAGDAALARIAASAAGEKPAPADALLQARTALALLLARGEATVARLVEREAGTRKGANGLGIALSPRRLCTLATPAQGPWPASNGGTFDCALLARAPAELHLKGLGFHESVRLSLDRWFDSAARDGARELGALSLDGSAASGDAGSVARAIEAAVPDRVALGRSDCGWTRPGGCAANASRAAMEEAMAAALSEASTRSAHAAGATTGELAESLDTRIGAALLGMDAQLEATRHGALAFTDRLFLIGNLLRLIGWLAVLLVTVKSFLYVLALEVFRSDGELSLGFDGAPAIQGSYRAAKRLTIERDSPGPLITRKQLSNADNEVRFAPWPGSAPIGRILSGCYFLFTRGRFLADAGHQPAPGQAATGMVASASAGRSIVEWRLQPGEEVVFRYRDFFGASENLQLDSEISLRLSTLLLGRVLFRIARCEQGEGLLLLKADVEANEHDDLRAIPPERMLAWNRHARFTVHSGRTAWTTLLNGYTLVRSPATDGPPGRILVSSAEVGSLLGSLRFIRRIVRAIF
ncbi:hypothetical protein BH11PSE14_BH11PSE14_04110 [soil metagenome]